MPVFTRLPAPRRGCEGSCALLCVSSVASAGCFSCYAGQAARCLCLITAITMLAPPNKCMNRGCVKTKWLHCVTCTAFTKLCSRAQGLQDAACGSAAPAPACSRSAHFVVQLPTSEHVPHRCAAQDALRLAAQGCDALPTEVLAKLPAAAPL